MRARQQPTCRERARQLKPCNPSFICLAGCSWEDQAILERGVGAQSAIRRVGVLGEGGRWKEEKGGRRRRWLTGRTPAKTTRGREEEEVAHRWNTSENHQRKGGGDPHTHTEEVAHRCNHQRDHQRKGGEEGEVRRPKQLQADPRGREEKRRRNTRWKVAVVGALSRPAA